MNKKITVVCAAIIVVAIAAYALIRLVPAADRWPRSEDYLNATYMIGGSAVALKNGVSDIEAAPGSSARMVTRYFSNEARTDLDGDGRGDVAFVLTQETGGSGLFFYVVAALNKESGYVGSRGYLLGDRIEPQSLGFDPQGSIIVTYADRAAGESFATPPTVMKTVRLALDPQTMELNAATSSENSTQPYNATMTGTQVCLPHKDTSGPQTMECAIGFKADGGAYYVLDFNRLPGGNPNIRSGAHVTAAGVVTPIENLNTDHWQKYNAAGVFSVTELLVVD